MTGIELYAIYGLFNYCRVFLKAFQGINVVNGKYGWVFPTSQGMGQMDVFSFAIPGVVAVESGIFSMELVWLGVVWGTTGWLGSITAMKLHGVQPNE